MQLVDITGKRYGAVVVVSKAPTQVHTRWYCVCDCGRRFITQGNNLKSGKTKSCGCAQRAMMTKHGHVGSKGKPTSTYITWRAMHLRCKDPKHRSYPAYGGRGITVCEEWGDFAQFLADMGERPDGMTLDRKETNIGYCKSNCRWATPQQQVSNKRKSRGKARTQTAS